jgi:hypothetical protein
VRPFPSSLRRSSVGDAHPGSAFLLRPRGTAVQHATENATLADSIAEIHKIGVGRAGCVAGSSLMRFALALVQAERPSEVRTSRSRSSLELAGLP